MPDRQPRKKPLYRDDPLAVTARRHAAFQPFAVVLIYRKSLMDPEDYAITIYARAPRPDLAVQLARKTWAYYTKEVYLPRGSTNAPEWPKLDDRADVMVLDDDDYFKLWKEAQTHKRWWSGHEANPIAFWFETDIKM